MSTKRMELHLRIMKLLPSLLCDSQIFTEWLKFNSLQITSCKCAVDLNLLNGRNIE